MQGKIRNEILVLVFYSLVNMEIDFKKLPIPNIRGKCGTIKLCKPQNIDSKDITYDIYLQAVPKPQVDFTSQGPRPKVQTKVHI